MAMYRIGARKTLVLTSHEERRGIRWVGWSTGESLGYVKWSLAGNIQQFCNRKLLYLGSRQHCIQIGESENAAANRNK
jgi:hypothetical protein